MTSKLSWIAFVPFSLAAIAIEVIKLFYMDANGTFYGYNSLVLSYAVIACAVLMLLFAAIFCLIDRKTAPVYLIKKNAISGIFGLLLAVALACEGANRAFVLFRSMSMDFFEVTDIILTILCAIVFVVLGLNHFVGNGGVKGLAVFYLVPALFCAFRLVKCFLDFTTVSIAVTDVSILACYIFATLFLFNYAMIIALMKGKSPVRLAYIYGLPAVIILLSYSVYELTYSLVYKSVTFTLFDNLEAVELCLLAVYILSFVIEMSAFVKRKDEIELVEDDEAEEYDEVKDPDADFVNAITNSAVNGNDPDAPVTDVVKNGYNSDNLSISDEVFIEVAQASLDSAGGDYIDDVDTSDFIYGAPPSDDDFVLPVDAEENFEEEPQETETADMYITKEDSTYDVEEDIPAEDVDSRMDRIDKLILEISEDEFN